MHDIEWTSGKIIVSSILIISSAILALLGFVPLLEMYLDAKTFANCLFSSLTIIAILNFMRIETTSNFVLWVASTILIDMASLIFFFYEEIFF